VKRWITYASCVATALVVVYVAVVLLPLWRSPERPNTTAGGTKHIQVIAVHATVVTTAHHSVHPAPIPPAATAVAITYAIASFSSSRGRPNDAWIDEVVSLCAPAWCTHLEAATSAEAVAAATVTPSVVATYPSWAPKGSVGITVLLRRAGALESLYLELSRRSGRYLVEATQ